MPRAIFALALLFAVASCGGSPAEEETTQTETTSGGETGSAADVAWADMDQTQRFAFMQETVVPEMSAMFQEYDGEQFADFGCATCHGDNAQDVGFHMPNGLAPLDPSMIGPMFESDQPMAGFMTQRVFPRMAELLGEAPMDETGQGFGCLRCHATAEGG